MLKRILNNLNWKILSILLAFFTWFIIMNIEDPVVTRTFSEIQVQKINAEIIEAERMAIKYREGETVTIKVSGKRSVIDSMTTSDIYAFADLEKKSITDAVDINIELPTNINLVSKTPSMMLVELEDVVAVQKEVQLVMSGEPLESYIYMNPVVEPNNIEIEGPRSKIASIKSVLLPVTLDNVTQDVSLYARPQIIDEDGEEINGLTLGTPQVHVQVPIQKVKTLDLVIESEGMVAEGYELVSLTMEQDTIQVRGVPSTVNSYEQIVIDVVDNSLANMYADATIKISAKSILPSTLTVYEDVDSISIKVDIEPIENKVVFIGQRDIDVRDIPEGLRYSFVSEETYVLNYEGIENNLINVNSTSVEPSISLEGLGEGVHTVALNYVNLFGTNMIGRVPNVEIELTRILSNSNEEDSLSEEEVVE